jgi:hypothetical protein
MTKYPVGLFMKFFILLLVFFHTTLFSQSLMSKEKIKEEASNRKLSHIKSCTEQEYGYSFGKRNEIGEKTKYTEYNKNGFESLQKIYEKEFIKSYSESQYDPNNNLITYSEYDSKNNLISKRINKYINDLHIESVQFNAAGEIEYKQYFDYDSKKSPIGGKSLENNGSIYSKWKFKYEGNNLSEEIFYDSVGKISSKSIYGYSNNKKIKEIHLKSDGAKLDEILFEYPSKNKMIQKVSRYILADPFVSKLISLFDKNGRTIEQYSENLDGTLNWRVKYSFDKNGNSIEEIHYNSLNEPDRSSRYEYEY